MTSFTGTETQEQFARAIADYSLIDDPGMTLRRTVVETGYAEVDGGRLYYETSGEGPALVLIHAGFLDSRMWDTQFSYSQRTTGSSGMMFVASAVLTLHGPSFP